MKTPEELASEWYWENLTDQPSVALPTNPPKYPADPRKAFLAGYQAAKDQFLEETGFRLKMFKDENDAKAAFREALEEIGLDKAWQEGYQAAKDQLADVDKVIIPKENCEAALKAMQSAQDLSEQAIRWMKTLPPASERCNQCACEGYRAGYQAAAPQWISVKDSLPPPRRLVMYFHELHGPSVGHYSPDCPKPGYQWISEKWGDNKTDRITHWMPLPQPPKEEG